MMAKRGAPSAWWRCLVPALIFASLGSAAAIKRDDVTFPDPPQKLPVMKLTADDLNKIADDFEASQKDLLARITNVSLDDANFNNTFQVYAEDAANAQVAWSRIEGLELWAAAAELQAAANAANDRITQMGQLLLKDERVYARFEKVYKKFELDDQLGSVEGRIVRRYYDAAKDSAANSPTSPERGRVAAIDQECTDLERQFTQNIQHENTTLWYTLQELDGVDQSTLDGLSKGEGANAGKFGVPAKTAYGLTYAVKNETVRQNMVIAQNNLFPQNVDIIKKSVVLRDEEARLLNYSNWAAEVLGDGDRLAKSTEDVSDFLKNLQDKLSPVARIFGQNLVNENKKDNPSATLPFVWNNGYYGNKISQERFKTNSTFHINEYFPAEHTLSEILDMYSDMFGFMFQPLHGDCLDRLSPTGNGSDLVWHEDVKIYAVWDEPTSQGQPPEFVGFIYVDMYGRENKVPGSWNQPLEPGWSVPNGERHYPTTGVVANLKKAAADSDIPTLLGANDVSILLHELVHAMHHISCQVQFGVQCGPSYAPTEFVELPSQMLQDLVYEYSVAARIGLHWAYLDESFQAIWHRKNPDVPLPPRTIPQDQMNVVLASRAYNAAPKTLSQVHTSTYDLVIHTPETHDAATQLDVTAIWNKLALEITGFYGGESLTNPPDYHWSIGEAGYVDVVNQYAGDAWAYLWALADAKDCFYTRFAQDPMSPTVAREFRRKVLAPGSSMNYTSLIVDFLGRPPNQDAFLKSLGA